MTITLTKDDISPALAILRAQAKNPRRVMAAAAGGVSNLFKAHLRGLNRTHPNKLGGRRTNMWNEFANSTNISVLTDKNATISISDPRAAHKHTGGVIKAKRSKFLTIPVAKEAYGRRVSTFETETGVKLFLLKRAGANQAVLAGRLTQSTARRAPGVKRAQGEPQEQGFKIYYVLKKSVTQGPDPKEGILPPLESIKLAALTMGQQALTRQLKIKTK